MREIFENPLHYFRRTAAEDMCRLNRKALGTAPWASRTVNLADEGCIWAGT